MYDLFSSMSRKTNLGRKLEICKQSKKVFLYLLCLIHSLLRVLQDKTVVSETLKMVRNKFDSQLVDFDNHLDNVRLDWTNSDLNRALPCEGN